MAEPLSEGEAIAGSAGSVSELPEEGFLRSIGYSLYNSSFINICTEADIGYGYGRLLSGSKGFEKLMVVLISELLKVNFCSRG